MAIKIQHEVNYRVDNLELPSSQEWKNRREWFEKIEEETRGEGSFLVSEQACALLVELQSVFCVGAWAAVIIIAAAIVDAQLRETEIVGFKGNTKNLIDLATNGNADLHWLRKRRNALVHVNPDAPAITVDSQWFDRPELEADARKAVEVTFEAFYLSPGT